ncbi:unnamed protein product [Pleuronectes platessa]|uniref:Uncharacterized protein n=1 Tax=Pleuronectes platessa TaxID=8262 RepID=A0A9N7TL75_PLEPL|nr:unnamed protein product [Pleuronectes platessa]
MEIKIMRLKPRPRVRTGLLWFHGSSILNNKSPGCCSSPERPRGAERNHPSGTIRGGEDKGRCTTARHVWKDFTDQHRHSSYNIDSRIAPSESYQVAMT